MKILIIGAGPGGYETALAARKYGFDVILAESGHVGGTCLNAGCIPTKAYCRSAEIMEEIRQAGKFGVLAGEPVLDFSQVKNRKDGIVSGLRANVESLLEASGVRLVRGRAVFRDSGTVAVGGEDCKADYIIIATGSVPVILPVEGMSLPGVLDSAGLLDLETLPSSLCIIGGGVIGLEFASVFRSFGCQVTVVEYCREVLPRFDQDIAKRLRQSLSRKGVVFSMQSEVTSVESLPDGKLKVNWLRKGVTESCEAEKVLVAVGRRPDISGLGTDAAGIALSDRGAVAVDDDMRTNIPHIFAIGDVNGRNLLAHAATAQGRIALRTIMKETGVPDSRTGDHTASVAAGMAPAIPSAVFTEPQAASVGLTEEDCKSAPAEYKVYKSFYRSNGKAVCMGETDGLCKILASPDGKILGCHVLGPHAADMVQEISSLMTAGAGVEQLRQAVHIHPTLGEILVSAVE